jgi:hypothetical protein
MKKLLFILLLLISIQAFASGVGYNKHGGGIDYNRHGGGIGSTRASISGLSYNSDWGSNYTSTWGSAYTGVWP